MKEQESNNNLKSALKNIAKYSDVDARLEKMIDEMSAEQKETMARVVAKQAKVYVNGVEICIG